MASEMAQEVLSRLNEILEAAPSLLRELAAEQAAVKPGPDRWSKKEELGHLIDSAANKHGQIVRLQVESGFAVPQYDGDVWVRIHRYQERDWSELIQTWLVFNRQLLFAAEHAPSSAWSNTCVIGDAPPMTLEVILEKYVTHLSGHLNHIGVTIEEIGVPGHPEKPAATDHPINELLSRRWSPVVFAEGRSVERTKILGVLEAARWAPSCFNEQPWRYLVFDGTDPGALDRARDCLVEGNAWARKAPVLLLSIAVELFSRNEKPNRHAQHDVGLASENLVLQVGELGLAAHQMAGFDADRARTEFDIPPDCTPIAMIAIGYPYRGSLETVPEKLRERDLAPRQRKPLADIAYAGKWGIPYGGAY
jgi:nitroreductase